MPLRPTDLVHRPVGDREVDFVGCGASLLRTEAQAPEQGLRHTVMALILLQRPIPAVRKSALSAKARDQPELLQRTEVGEGRRGSNAEPRSDVLQARAPPFALSGGDDPQGLDLSMGELLEGLHVGGELPTVYIGYPNY